MWRNVSLVKDMDGYHLLAIPKEKASIGEKTIKYSEQHFLTSPLPDLLLESIPGRPVVSEKTISQQKGS